VHGEKVTFVVIALALLVIAAVAFVHDLVLAPAREQFAVTVSRDVSSALSIVGVLELLGRSRPIPGR
jgi:hypothetical protein